jgi:hypothetical protein
MSILNTRLGGCDQVIEARRSAGVGSSVDDLALSLLPRCAGVIRARCLLFGAPTVGALGEHAMQAGQVHSWPGNQGSEPGHEIKRLKDDVRRAMPKALASLAGQAFPARCFQLVANIAIGRQPQPLLGYLRAAEVPAQAFQSRRCSTSCIPAVVGIPFQLSLAFQVVADGQRQDLGQSGELGA